MTAPTGTVGPNRDRIEQRIRDLEERHGLLERRGLSNTGVLTSDPNGGIATPWLPVVLYPLFAPPAGVFARMAAAVNVAEQTLWVGRIGYVTHPQIQVDGIWGQDTGTNSTRYRLKVAGVTVGTWDVATAAASAIQGGYSLLAATALRAKNVAVEVTAQSLSGTGTYACQALACHLRQT